MFLEIFFPKLGSKRSPFWTKGQKNRSGAEHAFNSKPCKIETYGISDLKLDFTQSLLSCAKIYGSKEIETQGILLTPILETWEGVELVPLAAFLKFGRGGRHY